ncbi:MAG: NAD-dependent epimerase/dehydratase family protein, partial [Spirochaetia bacterium]|nr:NAD-dependent epimerase/dehydratase family protein [Spirochaetia bacterium]
RKEYFPPEVKRIESDLFTLVLFSEALANVDLAIYSAGVPEQWLRDKSHFNRINHDLFKTFLDAITGKGINKLIYISTYEVFAEREREIRESHPITSVHTSSYFDSMTKAFKIAKDCEKKHNLDLITIHPAAVYGGVNTRKGATDLILNVKNRNFRKLRALINSSFPLAHVDSLADGVLRAIERNKWGESYIFSDGMTCLETVVRTVKSIYPSAYVPMKIPVWLARLSAFLLEFIANHITHRTPIISKVQIGFITRALRPSSEKAERELGWKPMPLPEGIKKMFEISK